MYFIVCLYKYYVSMHIHHILMMQESLYTKVLRVDFTCMWFLSIVYFAVIKCSPILFPFPGNMTCVDTLEPFSFGSRCSFTCQKGYSLMGDTTMTCLPSGKWTSSTPTCAGLLQIVLQYQNIHNKIYNRTNISLVITHNLFTFLNCLHFFSSGSMQQVKGSPQCLHRMRQPPGRAQLWLNMHSSVWQRLWFDWHQYDQVLITGPVESRTSCLPR